MKTTALELLREINTEAYATYATTLDICDYVPERVIAKHHAQIHKVTNKIRRRLWRKFKRQDGFFSVPSLEKSQIQILDAEPRGCGLPAPVGCVGDPPS